MSGVTTAELQETIRRAHTLDAIAGDLAWHELPVAHKLARVLLFLHGEVTARRPEPGDGVEAPVITERERRCYCHTLAGGGPCGACVLPRGIPSG